METIKGRQQVLLLAVFIVTCWLLDGYKVEAGPCRLLWDQSRGALQGVKQGSVYSSFLAEMQSSPFDLSIQTIPYGQTLDAQDYEGVRFLWLDGKNAANSTIPYSPTELDTIMKFVRSGGSLLILIDISDPFPAVVNAASQMFGINILLKSKDFNMTYGTVNSTDSRFTAGVNTLYSPSIGLSLDIALNAEAVDGVVINGPVLAYTPGILAVADIDYFPRGRVVVVWDADIFDQFYNDADNAQLAKNILTFLTENCATGGGCNGNCPGGQGICFADYCYCNSSFTGDSCEKGLSPCLYQHGCPAQPLTPTLSNPVQCPAGNIMPAMDLCSAEIACWPPNRACVNGSCLTAQECMATVTNCNQILCANGQCVSSVLDCPIVPSCNFAQFRCPTGDCVANLTDCPVPPNCPMGTQLCLDGICRQECPLYDGCNASATNFLCPDWQCVAYGSPNSSLITHKDCMAPCDGVDGHTCWDGVCDAQLPILCSAPPPYTYSIPKTNILIDHTRDLTIPLFGWDTDGYPNLLLRVEISNGTFNSDVQLVVSPIGLGNLRDSIGEFTTFTLAAILDLKISPSTPFSVPIYLDFIVTPPRTFNQTRSLNASMVFVGGNNTNWEGLLTLTIQTILPVLILNSPTPPAPPPTFSAPTPHFTSFSVLAGEYGSSSSNVDFTEGSGDGNLGVILPAVLIPVISLTVIVIMVAILGGIAAVAYLHKRRLNVRLGNLASATIQESGGTIIL